MTYLNVRISNNRFYIEQVAKKPSKYNLAEETLSKIDYILRNNLQYDSTRENDTFSGQDLSKIHQFLRAKTARIHTGYSEKVRRLNLIFRILFSVEKTISSLHDRIDRHFIPAKKLVDLPADIFSILGSFLSNSDFGSLMRTSKSIKSLCHNGYVERSKQYGYEGSDYREAAIYAGQLRNEIYQCCSSVCVISKGKEYYQRIGYINIVDNLLLNMNYLQHRTLIGPKLGTLIYKKAPPLNLPFTVYADYISYASNLRNASLLKYFLLTKIDFNNISLNILYWHAFNNAHQPIFWFSRIWNKIAPFLASSPVSNSGIFLELMKYLNDQKNWVDKSSKMFDSNLEQLVPIFIKLGGDISSRNEGKTLLTQACELGMGYYAQALLNGGADPNMSDSEGNLPLHLAARMGHRALVESLVTKGAQGQVNQPNNKGLTPFMLAIRSGNQEIVHFLLESGADLEFKDPFEATPLMFACGYGSDEANPFTPNPEVVKLLLELGVNRLAKNTKDDEDAIFYAYRHANKAIRDLLKTHSVAT